MNLALFVALLLGADPVGEQPALKLWAEKAPESVGKDELNQPILTPYLVPKEKATGAAVVICPGGGYGFLAMNHEGKEIAEWLNARGIQAFILQYRIVRGADRPAPLGKAPLLDVQRAIRMVRAKAKDYQIDPNRIGVWGFSAGGHLASSVTVHWDKGDPKAKDPIEQVSCRPDFSILAYPVITMGPKTHGGSKKNLLGDKPDPALVEFFSNEKHVTKETPPVFLFHTAEDKAVVIENSYLFKKACEAAGVPVTLAEYEKGVHGIGLASKSDLPAKEWPSKLEAWLKEQKIIPMK